MNLYSNNTHSLFISSSHVVPIGETIKKQSVTIDRQNYFSGHRIVTWWTIFFHGTICALIKLHASVVHMHFEQIMELDALVWNKKGQRKVLTVKLETHEWMHATCRVLRTLLDLKWGPLQIVCDLSWIVLLINSIMINQVMLDSSE